jgi:hypothetical protein
MSVQLPRNPQDKAEKAGTGLSPRRISCENLVLLAMPHGPAFVPEEPLNVPKARNDALPRRSMSDGTGKPVS